MFAVSCACAFVLERDCEFAVIACAVSALLVVLQRYAVRDDDRNTQWVQGIAALEFVVLTLDSFLSTVLHSVTMRYH